MASFLYNNAKRGMLAGEIDMNADDIRAALCDSTTTADTEKDKLLMNAFSTLGELSGTGYGRIALTTEAVNQDDGNNRAEFDADDVAFGTMDGDNADAVGILLYKHVTNDTDSIPIAWIDTGGFPVTFNGGTFTVTWNVEGIFHF